MSAKFLINNGRHENRPKLRQVSNTESTPEKIDFNKYPALKKAHERCIKGNVKTKK